ncbi:MAG: translesion DNA synthesis-associated protein ImuA, partial [Pseudomonadota bacterium]
HTGARTAARAGVVCVNGPFFFATLEQVLQRQAVWRCSGRRSTAVRTVTTGYPALDSYLPGGGWPLGQLLEIVSGRCGIGELRLIMPALAALAAGRDGYIVWVAPPCQPYAPALAQWGLDVSRVLVVDTDNTTDALWVTGEALNSGSALAVLGWLPRLTIAASRRLQTVAAASGAFTVAYRPASARREPTAAALRLALYADSTGTGVDVFKVRGARPARLGAFETTGEPGGADTAAANPAVVPVAAASRYPGTVPATGLVSAPLPG